VQALFVLLAMAAGLSNPVQSAANAAVNRPLREWPAKAGGIPWSAYVGGLCNLLFALAGAAATQKIGSGAFTVTVLVTAVALSIVLDHFDWLGLPHHPATWPRLLGGAFAIGGVIVVSLF
jgi:transporter family-2 protein